MSIDMSQFYQVFFEESAEHLAEMERLLLQMDVDAPDVEEMNAIFRAAHSIKGGSGTFGFTDMTEVTHVLENLLDRLRKGEMAPRSEMIDVFLEAADVLKHQLQCHVNGTDADAAQAAAVCARLRELTEQASPAAESDQEAPSMPRPGGESGTSAEAFAQRRYEIVFTPGADFLTRPHAIEDLTSELSRLGQLQTLEAPADGKKGKKNRKGKKAKKGKPSATAWRFLLETPAPPEAVQELFAFVAAPSEFSITPQHSTAHGGTGHGLCATVDVSPPPDADADGYGFFAPLTAPVPAEDGYGFFDTAPAAAGAEEDAGYGFFTDVTARNPSAGEEGDGYGFFAPLPAPPTEIASPPASARSATAAKAKPASATEATIRVGVERVDQLINLVGELVITQAMLAQTASRVDPVLYEDLHNGLAQLERNTRDLQESVMSIRMMPISFVFSRFPRVVRDLAGKLNKQVELITIGETTELDKSLIEKIADPLTHLVRNSLDHGIEPSDQRLAAGKPARGTITLAASQQGGNILIEVRDDGAGLNREKILAKARERGLSVSDGMSDGDVWALIFEPGFSTAEVVTDVSGRGVGMDVVKRNITEMGGSIAIDSAPGMGTAMTIRLPLTLAILDGMTVALGDAVYVIPLNLIVETMQPQPGDLKTVTGQGHMVHVRGEYLPIIALHRVFNMATEITDPSRGVLVLIETEGRKAALFVDALVGQQQVVIKSLETNFRRINGISGATIMGDGTVALILDVAALIRAGQGTT